MTNPGYVDIVEEEFAKALGAKLSVSRDKLTLFIAHKDRESTDLSAVQVATWVTNAKVVLSEIGGGATATEAEGAWIGDDRTSPIHEPTTLVYTYAAPAKIQAAASALRTFAQEYGNSTNQGEVAVLLENSDGDWFFKFEFPRKGAPDSR